MDFKDQAPTPNIPGPAAENTRSSPGEEVHRNTIVVDRDWHIVRLDPSLRMLLGFRRAAGEFVGYRLWEVFPRLLGLTAERWLREAMQEWQPRDFEFFYGPADTWLHAAIRPSALTLTIGLREISERKQQQETVASLSGASAAEALLLEATLSSLGDFAYLFNPEGRIAYANRPLLALWGRAAHEALGRNFFELDYPPELAGRLQRKIQDVFATRTSAREETPFTNSKGIAEYHDYVFNPVFAGDGSVRLVAGSARVVTARRHAEEMAAADAVRAEKLGTIALELLSGETQDAAPARILRSLAEAMGAEFYLHHEMTPDGHGLRFEASGGFTHSQLARIADVALGEGLCGIAAQRGAPVIVEHVQAGESTDAAALGELGIRACACHPLKAGGRLLGTLAFATKSRDRFTDGELRFMQTAADLLAAGLERRRALAELRDARDAAEKANRAKDDFLAKLSHELRTPLNPVLLLASDAAINPLLPRAAREDFEVIAKNIALETRLIDDLLDLTRIAHGKFSLNQTVLNLHAVLEDVLTTLTADVKEKNIVLHLDLATQPLLVRGDPLRLQQVFWNILRNAVKFTPKGGTVSVRTTATPANDARVETTDTGIGLTDDEAKLVFESFTQGEHARDGVSSFGGLGLGLAITRNLVEQHSGRIRALSAGRGRGASFIVELPLAHEPAGAAAEMADAENPPVHSVAVPSADDSAEPAEITHGVRILVVEDHRSTREALLQLLVQRDYEVIGVESVRDARAVAARKHFDLVIADIGLPDGNGYDLMTALRSDFGLRGIALTGYGAEQDLARAHAAGFLTHLTKPTSIQSLEAALITALRTLRASGVVGSC